VFLCSFKLLFNLDLAWPVIERVRHEETRPGDAPNRGSSQYKGTERGCKGSNATELREHDEKRRTEQKEMEKKQALRQDESQVNTVF
jgi:hypothetical protein